MARVFTITPGLENMGALKTGGQGSVYKARRIGEIITAVKILPTPIYSESADDKNFVAFENEVSKLKKVNEEPNPNVVKILNSGITESGNLPFIEMEFIEGPDLEDLLKPPHEPIFTIKEVLKVAEQLSKALAHCHKLDIRHGDIKSNNVKFSNKTANYVLLDFGLAIMSDEERRSSLRQAGAIEFMAPEQNTGQMLFETDVYSFGVVLYELLAGTVPFRLKDRSEVARNEVRLAHMVTSVPDLLELRKQALPVNWDEQKRQHEMHVPEWLLKMIYKCLEKKPAARFKNGIELYRYITENFTNSGNLKVDTRGSLLEEKDWNNLLNQNKNLQEQVGNYQKEVLSKNREMEVLKMQLNNMDKKLQSLESEKQSTDRKSEKGVSKASFTLLLFFTIALAAFAIFSVVKSSPSANQQVQKLDKKWDNSNDTETNSEESSNIEEIKNQKKVVEPVENKSKEQSKAVTENKRESTETEVDKPGNEEGIESNKRVESLPEPERKQTDERQPGDDAPQERKQREEIPPVEKENNQVLKRYKVVEKAYFYARPEEGSREDMFIGPWENAIVEAVSERYGFVFVEIKDPQGQVFRGWLRKKDLKLHSIN